MSEPVTYAPPEPNAALVVGPDEYLILGFSNRLTLLEFDEMKKALPAALDGRVLIVSGADLAVIRKDETPPTI